MVERYDTIRNVDVVSRTIFIGDNPLSIKG